MRNLQFAPNNSTAQVTWDEPSSTFGIIVNYTIKADKPSLPTQAVFLNDPRIITYDTLCEKRLVEYIYISLVLLFVFSMWGSIFF